jgi:4-amino-4-deoxy-L-arabinose transferase-like glycosyltransferase
MTKNWFLVFLTSLLLTHFFSLFTGIMEVDATLYAIIAKNIVLHNDWINLIGDGHDWLDKPHLPFWLIAVSYKIFGINDIAYKVPGFAFFLVGIIYCYKTAQLLFKSNIARVATIIYVSALHIFIAVFDVKAEAYLTTCILAASFHLLKSLDNKTYWHIVWASLFAAAAVLIKGVFVLITIGAGFFIYWILTKQLKHLLQIKWVVFFMLLTVFILPEIYCLYVQFDLHPEKIVFGKNNVSGIQFFLWDSQFGRFFNSGPIKGSGEVFFFVHTFIWAFLPWSFIGYYAIYYAIKNFIKTNNKAIIVIGNVVITFLLFSFSKFQLPHYIVILFPHFAILTAFYLSNIESAIILKRWNRIQLVIIIIAGLLVLAIAYISNFSPFIYTLLLVVFAIFLIGQFFFTNDLLGIIGKSVCFSIALFAFLNCCFYPSLLTYQGGKNAAIFCNNNNIKQVIFYKCSSYSFEWNFKNSVTRLDDITALPIYVTKSNKFIAFIKQENLADLKYATRSTCVLYTAKSFPVSQLNLAFLNPTTRLNAMENFLIVECIIK